MRIHTAALILALFTTALLPGAPSDQAANDEAVIMISETDSCAYVVEPGETLGDAMTKGALAQIAQEEEKGSCVRDDRVGKPEGAVGCKCYEHTECNGNESHTCKRHCRRDLCECCSPST